MSNQNTFRVGYARTDITPLESVPLRGYGNTSKRLSQNCFDPLYATCLAFTDANGQTALLFAMDLTGPGRCCSERLRPAISEATGVPVDAIMASCTHNHSAPDLDNTEMDSIPRYIDYLERQMIAAAKAALEDRKPAEMYITSVQTERLNFVRRYVLEDGTYAGDNYGHFQESPIACHESEADHQLQLLKFIRQGGKEVIIANFQMHPHRTGGSKKYDISADVTGAMRAQMEARLDCCFAYFTGGSGNVNGTSRVPEENIVHDYLAHGAALAEYAVNAEGTYTPVATGRVKTATVSKVCPANHHQEELLEIARELRDEWTRTGDSKLCIAKGLPYGINSPYHAGAIVRRAQNGPTFDIDIWTVSIGDVAFAVAPYEMFDTNGMQIKEGSPFKMTMILTCANAGKGYIPSKLGYAHGGYSVDTCNFQAGTGELLAEEYIGMLKKLHAEA